VGSPVFLICDTITTATGHTRTGVSEADNGLFTREQKQTEEKATRRSAKSGQVRSDPSGLTLATTVEIASEAAAEVVKMETVS